MKSLETTHLGFDTREGEGHTSLPIAFEQMGGMTVEGDQIRGWIG